MSNFQLKLVAIITMLIDHIGMILFPQIFIFRIIGRISFPIFCFLITEGYIHTSNFKRYLIRLGLFAIISQIPFNLALTARPFYFYSLNVFFTLFFGAVCIWLIDKQRPFIAIPCIIAIMLLVTWLKTDYSYFGIMLMLAYYLARNNKILRASSGSILCIGKGILQGAPYYLEAWGAISALPILLYNGKKGKYSFKYFFYIFYPAHLLILHFIRAYWFL